MKLIEKLKGFMKNREEKAAEKKFESIWGKPIPLENVAPNQCEHLLNVPQMTVDGDTFGGHKFCGAYFDNSKNSNRAYLHFPYCAENICPFKHPELLDGDAASNNS